MDRSPWRKWSLLFTVAASLLLITLDNSVLYTALPTLTRELGASVSQGLWIINAYPLVMAGLLLAAGSALGPVVGGMLLKHFWWGSVFLLNVPVTAAAFISGLVVTPRAAAQASRPWDLLSSAQVLVALSGLVLAIKQIAHAPPAWPLAATALAVAIVAGALFARRQTRLPYPLLDFTLFRNPAFLAGVLAAAVAMFTIGGVQLITTQRFQLVAGYSPLDAGLVVSFIAMGCLPSTLLGGALLHKTGLRLPIVGGLMVAAAGILLAAFGLQAGLAWLLSGMASSVEEVSYEFGSLLAVALLGSLLASMYSVGLALPEGIPDGARDSITAALAIAGRDGIQGTALIAAASAAFDAGYLIVMYVIAAVLFSGAMAASVLLRRHGAGSAKAIQDPLQPQGTQRASKQSQ